MVDKIEELLSLSKGQLLDIGYKLEETILKRFNDETIKLQLLKLFEV